MFDDENTFISLDHLAARCGLPKTYLKELAESGDIPCLNVNGRRRFNPVRVQQALDRIAADAPTGGAA